MNYEGTWASPGIAAGLKLHHSARQVQRGIDDLAAVARLHGQDQVMFKPQRAVELARDVSVKRKTLRRRNLGGGRVGRVADQRPDARR